MSDTNCVFPTPVIAVLGMVGWGGGSTSAQFSLARMATLFSDSLRKLKKQVYLWGKVVQLPQAKTGLCCRGREGGRRLDGWEDTFGPQVPPAGGRGISFSLTPPKALDYDGVDLCVICSHKIFISFG